MMSERAASSRKTRHLTGHRQAKMADDAILHDASAERRCLGALRPLVLMISSNKDNEDGMSYLIGHHSSALNANPALRTWVAALSRVS